MPKVWRIVDLIQWSESYFREKSHQNPRLEIEWMLRSLLNCERLDLYMRFDEPLSGSQLSTLRGWVKRRSKNDNKSYKKYIKIDAKIYQNRLPGQLLGSS